ncbi:hypothetical protein E2C01_056204 [Portunus trituberculatus]|uniref:Uncharacterized protein n=1 Tax=Portunus trituberculatus TaxID=210409 RepID=A0A5B7GPQ3_PORTR|nr:hypothetical protein [Portunus trituberculatus]
MDVPQSTLPGHGQNDDDSNAESYQSNEDNAEEATVERTAGLAITQTARLTASHLTVFVPRNIVRPLGRYIDKFLGRLQNCSSLETFVKQGFTVLFKCAYRPYKP